MIKFWPIAEPPVQMRQGRLATLTADQELFVEMLVSNGRTYSLELDNDQIGYAIASGDKLIEYYGEAPHFPRVEQLFSMFLDALDIKIILAQTFDPSLMSLGVRTHISRISRGILYREIVDREFQTRTDIRAMPGNASDMAELAALSEDFFDSETEILSYLSCNGLFVYRDISSNLIGAGVLTAPIPGTGAIDVGMVVAPTHRQQGFGSFIVRHLKAHCLSKAWKPICGCDVDNWASQRTLASAGFVATHRLVEFTLK